jgi:hypothetical protein
MSPATAAPERTATLSSIVAWNTTADYLGISGVRGLLALDFALFPLRT